MELPENRNVIYGAVLVVILAVIGVFYFIGRMPLTPPEGMTVDSPDACKYACELSGYTGGDCRWPGEADISYASMGPCLVPMSRHCGNPGQCNCYCWSQPEFCSDAEISIQEARYDASTKTLIIEIYNSGTAPAEVRVLHELMDGSVVVFPAQFYVSEGEVNSLDILNVDPDFVEVVVEYPRCPNVRDSLPASSVHRS